MDFFSLNSGRFTVVAKGAKSGRKTSNAAILQPFRPLHIRWVGRGEVKTLTACEAAGKPYALVGKRLYCALYVNELLSRLLARDEPYPELFARYTDVQIELERSNEVETLLRHFEVFLLGQLGYGIDLDWDSENNSPIEENLRYRYVVEQGAVLVHKTTRNSVSGKTLLSLSTERRLEGEQLTEARTLMRQVLSTYLGDKPLKSRELFINTTATNKRDENE